jgi:hypothetical protein
LSLPVALTTIAVRVAIASAMPVRFSIQLRVAVGALAILVAVRGEGADVVGPRLGLGQKWAVNVGGFWADVNTIARAGGQGGRIGTRLDLEQDLGLDDHNLSFIGGVSYQFGRRHAFDLSYFELNRSAERTITTSIDFIDELFAPQTVVETSLDTQIWRLSYEYAFMDQPHHRATVQVGLHYVRLAAELARSAGTRSAVASAKAPLPVLGLGYAYRFSPRWMFETRAQFFRLQFDDMDGSIDNFSAVVAAAPFRTVNVFAGYNYYRMNVDISKQLWDGESKLDYKGPWLGFVVGFGGG